MKKWDKANLLLRQDANPNIPRMDGKTCLISVVEGHGPIYLVKCLLKLGAKVKVNYRGMTAVGYAHDQKVIWTPPIPCCPSFDTYLFFSNC